MLGNRSDQSVIGDSVVLKCMVLDGYLLVRLHEHQELDFAFIYEITKKCYCANYQRPLIDPVLFIFQVANNMLLIVSYQIDDYEKKFS